MSMTSKRIQVVHVNKSSDKIVIAQATHNTAMGPMTRSKVKWTSSPSIKQTCDFTCLLKPVRTHDEHQPCNTLAFLGTKSHIPHSKRKLPLALKDFKDKRLCSITNTNSSIGSYSGFPTRTLKKENYSTHSNSFTYPFSMAMPIMATDTTSIEEQLVEMACSIAKFTKTVEEKDSQITSLINKVEAQVQNTGELSQVKDSTIFRMLHLISMMHHMRLGLCK